MCAIANPFHFKSLRSFARSSRRIGDLITLVITDLLTRRNTSPNQKRNLKPTVSNPSAYSASPSQLSLSSDLHSSALGHPYQPAYAYAHDPSAFAFPPPPQQYRPPIQTHGLQHPPPPPQPAAISPVNSRKRRASDLELPGSSGSNASAYGHPQGLGAAGTEVDVGLGPGQTQLPSPVAKKGRTNTPWTPAEEQRLKTLREAGSSWSEIAKTFPTRTEGSVKKHWYKVRMTTDLTSTVLLTVNSFPGYALCGVCGRRGQQLRSPHRENC